MKYLLWIFLAVSIVGVQFGCASPLPVAPATPARLGTSPDQATIQALHRRLHERERTIALQNSEIERMASQLDALKQIDQDTREHRRPVRNPMTFVP